MYLTQTNVVRGLTKSEYQMLAEMCRYSNSLYNVTLYAIRQYFFTEGKFLSFESNCVSLKTDYNYSMLQANVAQQTLRAVDRNFRSFFALNKKARRGEYRYRDVHIPRYRDKGDVFALILNTGAINVKDGFLRVPMSRRFRQEHGNPEPILIPFPKRLEGKTVKEVRILPGFGGRYFKIQYVYVADKIDSDVDENKVLAIDVGVNNLAACVSSVGTSFILDGRRIKSINQGWQKEVARLQSIAKKQGMCDTRRTFRLTEKRNNRIKDIIRKSARYIVEHCLEHKIGTVVVGYNPDFKKNINLGRINNQVFTAIPFSQFRHAIEGLCELYGIRYIEQEESYTSKASCLDGDFLPTYKPGEHYDGDFSGKRIKRGLYRTKNGVLVNADINGAANILRKSKQNFDFEGLCRGLLASPQRIRLV